MDYNPLCPAWGSLTWPKVGEFNLANGGYKSSCVHPRHPTVDVNRAAVKLYLRFRGGDRWPVGSVVIAVVQF
jgi:hypothetical protein